MPPELGDQIAAEGVEPRQAAVGREGGVELLDLGGGRPAPAAAQVADELDVDEIPRGQGVEVAATVDAEALQGPGADLGDADEAVVAGRGAQVAAAGGDLARGLDHRDRPLRGKSAGGELGGSERGDGRR